MNSFFDNVFEQYNLNKVLMEIDSRYIIGHIQGIYNKCISKESVPPRTFVQQCLEIVIRFNDEIGMCIKDMTDDQQKKIVIDLITERIFEEGTKELKESGNTDELDNQSIVQ